MDTTNLGQGGDAALVMTPFELISIIATVILGGITIVGILWFGLDRMKKDIKDDAKNNHDSIEKNIDRVHVEISDMRKELSAMNGRFGRIEGYLELKDSQPHVAQEQLDRTLPFKAGRND